MSTTTWSSDAIKMPCMAVFIVETHYDPAHSEERMAARPAHLENLDAVSYTHLTLPTNREV